MDKRGGVEGWRGGWGRGVEEEEGERHKAIRVFEWNLVHRRFDIDNFRQVMGNMQIVFNYIYFCFS